MYFSLIEISISTRSPPPLHIIATFFHKNELRRAILKDSQKWYYLGIPKNQGRAAKRMSRGMKHEKNGPSNNNSENINFSNKMKKKKLDKN